MTDARIVRTRAALHAAILELAAQKPVPDITVSELAQQAGINRVTFYKHYTSPADALGAAIERELADARQHFLAGHEGPTLNPGQGFREGVSLVLDHVERHRALYLLAINTPQDGSVPNSLANHFTKSMQEYLALRVKLSPPIPELDEQMVAGYYGYAMVGAIKGWLLKGNASREEFAQVLVSLIPTWWFINED
ncbi:TetR/AcrR family transcriptional regulator [Leucobacter insecticola]|uniref:TetR/AcrR family transcriptional regulator n=1 Tax=Leucobacter insecticola TaxID=2714934 RepID=A0A6G8FL88_9MICO|nr:TetR/AcrR family transcriptional regulator [Leucobacter insecticola]QIM17196.1 TetR/AcrR family transcriptional regulator [Leucobacter insecticola]